MKVAVMQPYFLPYIGYFQLIKAVDTFIFFDDVNLIKRGWINRNRIILNNEDYLFTLNLKGVSQFKKINEVEVGDNREKLIKTFIHAYMNAPFYKSIEPLIVSILRFPENSLSKFIINSIASIAEYIGIRTNYMISSEINKNNELKGQDKIVEMCTILGAETYVNPKGGQSLYEENIFRDHGIELKFLHPGEIKYKQFENEFIPWLSILDVLMFNSPQEVNGMLDKYTLV